MTGRDDIDVWDNLQQIRRSRSTRCPAYEAACLLAFGLAALAAALFLIGQSVARYTSATVADLQVLQAAGHDPAAGHRAPLPPGPPWPGWPAARWAWRAPSWLRDGCRSAWLPSPSRTPGIDADWLVLAPGWVLVPLLVLAGSAAAAAVALAAGRRQAPQRRSAIAAGRWPR